MRVMPRALSFDLDDTLWSCDDVIDRAERALHRWLAAHYPRITDEFGREAMRAVRREMAAARPPLAVDLTALRRASLLWHAQRAGYAPGAADGLADRGVEIFLDERNRVMPYEDVRPVLERLGAHYPLVALTNGNADVGRTPLADLFSASLSAADVGAAKPDPAIFRAACGTLGLRSGELIHVGDDPVRDVHGARAFGARTVWLNRAGAAWPEGIPRAHHELSDLHGLVALLTPESA